jgi:hypothetical protein
MAMNEVQARRRVRALRRFYLSLGAYIPTIAGLFALDMVTGAGNWWFYAAIGWGIGLAIRGVKTFGLLGAGTSEWEERKVAELTGQTPAQVATTGELQRLSQRIETLATIVASRKWEATEPLVGEAAEAVAAAAQRRELPPLPPPTPAAAPPPAPLDRERLVELVQHLETLLTSSELERVERVGDRRPGQREGS